MEFVRKGHKKKVLLFLIVTIIVALPSAFAEKLPPSFSANLGLNFFNYSEIYLDTGFAYNHPITDGLELTAGVDFSLRTIQQTDGTTLPYFFIPINIGLNFIFQNTFPTYLLGVGLSPVIRIPPSTDDKGRFYIGPYIKAGIRIRVHRLMNWFVNVYQDLLIGEPAWINTSTRIYTGINFRFTPY